MEIYHTAASALAEIFGGTKKEWASQLGRASWSFAGQGAGSEDPAVMWHEELCVLAAVCAFIRPYIALEIGVHKGASFHMTRNLYRPQINIAVDRDARCGDYCHKAVFYQADCNNLWTHDALSALVYDLIVIDSEHSYEATIRQLTWAASHTTKGSVVIVHDVEDEQDQAGIADRVAEGVRVFLERERDHWEGHTLRTPCGMAILRRTS